MKGSKIPMANVDLFDPDPEKAPDLFAKSDFPPLFPVFRFPGLEFFHDFFKAEDVEAPFHIVNRHDQAPFPVHFFQPFQVSPKKVLTHEEKPSFHDDSS